MHVESVISVPNRHGDLLHTTATIPDDASQRAPLMIILHGHKGFRNYGFLPWIAQGAADRGMIALRMCFSLNGMDNSAWLVQKPDDFARNTLSREVDDVHDLVRHISDSTDYAMIRDRWNGRLILVGHSRGGGIALVAGGELSTSTAPSWTSLRVAGLNAVGTWTRWTPRQAAAWKEAGFVDVHNQRTGQIVRIDASFVMDLETHADRLSLLTAMNRLRDNVVLIHAAQDLTVPLSEIQKLAASCDANHAVLTIENTTHTFGMTHPVERITPGFHEAFQCLMTWIES